MFAQAPWLPERIFADVEAVSRQWRSQSTPMQELQAQQEPGSGIVALALAGMLSGSVQLRMQQVHCLACSLAVFDAQILVTQASCCCCCCCSPTTLNACLAHFQAASATLPSRHSCLECSKLLKLAVLVQGGSTPSITLDCSQWLTDAAPEAQQAAGCAPVSLCKAAQPLSVPGTWC